MLGVGSILQAAHYKVLKTAVFDPVIPNDVNFLLDECHLKLSASHYIAFSSCGDTGA